MAATLDVGHGAVVSHQAAARLWRLPGFVDEEIHVSRPRRGGTRFRTEIAVVHRPQALPPSHLTTTRGIPVTIAARTIFDLAGVLHPSRVERALDNSLARRFTNIASLEQVTVELAEHGRSGSTLMRDAPG